MNGNYAPSSLVHEAQGDGDRLDAELVHDVGEQLLDRAREISESIVNRVKQLTESEPANGQQRDGRG